MSADFEQMQNEHALICAQEAKKDKALRTQWRKQLKGLINVSGLFNWLNEHEYWTPLEIVEIYKTDEKNSGYSNYQHVRIKNDSDNLLYIMQNEHEISGINHYCVWQTCGIMDDDYSGYLLFPLKNGKYFKINYAC